MPDHKVSFRELHTMQALRATVELQQAVWGMEPVDAASPYTMNAIIHNGGGVLGAEVDGQLVGFCFAFPSKRGDELWLWSHMAGVHPHFQGQQIGYKLKQFQKQWALDKGYQIMAWTFDPMQRGNAHFNLNQLGAICRKYYVNHYGEMTDKISGGGLASDRLEAYWRLDGSQVEGAEAAGETSTFLVHADETGEVHQHIPPSFEEDVYSVEIPYHIAMLKQSNLEKAKTWQLQVRQAITSLLDASFIVSGFVRDEGRCWYILRRDKNNR